MGREKRQPKVQFEPVTPEEAEWIRLGVERAFLVLSKLYKSGVRELVRLENLGLSREELSKAKATVDSRISEEIFRLVGPLMPTRPPDHAASRVFYGTFSKQLRNAKQNPKKLARAYALGLAEFDAEHRFLTPFVSILEAHAAGDRKASERYLRLVANNQRVRYGDGLPSMKGNLDHRVMMKNGLNLGLEKLSASKLASFYDSFCPCPLEVHDVDDLRKLRDRILEEARRAYAKVSPKFSGPNQL